MEIWREDLDKQLSPSDVCRSKIVEYKKFVAQLRPYGFDPKSVSIIVDHLRRMGLISVDLSEKGEKVRISGTNFLIYIKNTLF